jgi:glycosyltransferase involved in cell wall biosynthesis
MRSARILVVTSAVEGFGIVVLEANACGVPVVASSGVPEGAVRDGFNGLRYQFGDTKALSEALTHLLEDATLYRRLSRNALANVQRFRWSRVGAEFEQVVAAAATRHQRVRVARDSGSA